MKKTYIAPEVQEVSMTSQALLINVSVDPVQQTDTMDAKESFFDDFDEED